MLTNPIVTEAPSINSLSSADEPNTLINAHTPQPRQASVPASGLVKQPVEITVKGHPYRQQPGTSDSSAFTMVEAWHRGIDKPLEFGFADMWPPFWEGRSVASGDFDNDGDIDLVLASTEKGLYVYLNDGVGRFSAAVPDAGFFKDKPVFNAVMVDIAVSYTHLTLPTILLV